MVFDRLVALVAEQFGVAPETVTMDTSFVQDFNADSIDIVELMMAVEEEFEIGEIEESSLERVKTVGDVVQYIQERI